MTNPDNVRIALSNAIEMFTNMIVLYNCKPNRSEFTIHFPEVDPIKLANKIETLLIGDITSKIINHPFYKKYDVQFIDVPTIITEDGFLDFITNVIRSQCRWIMNRFNHSGYHIYDKPFTLDLPDNEITIFLIEEMMIHLTIGHPDINTEIKRVFNTDNRYPIINDRILGIKNDVMPVPLLIDSNLVRGCPVFSKIIEFMCLVILREYEVEFTSGWVGKIYYVNYE